MMAQSKLLATSLILSLVGAGLLACSDDEVPGGGPSRTSDGAPNEGADATVPPRAEAGVFRPRDARTVVVEDDAGAAPDAQPPADAADAGFVDLGPNRDNPSNPFIDSDCDGLSDAYEFSTVYADGQQTSVADPDSDGDGILDGIEVGRTSSVAMSGCPPLADADPQTTTLPTVADTDGDGIDDGLEDANQNGAVDPLELNPRSRDSDGDGLPDEVEDRNLNGRRDPDETHGALRDTETDGVADGVEDRDRSGSRAPDESDPLFVDTDADGLDDGVEDANANGLPEVYETIAFSPDTDCDGLTDGDEVNVYGTSPLVDDTDRDGITDGIELGVTSSVAGSICLIPVPVDADPTTRADPVDLDTDDDGVIDPLDPDADGDGIIDGDEDLNGNGRLDPGETDPFDADTDNDGLSDGDELRAGFNPRDPNDPPANQTNGLNTVCATNNLKVVDFGRNSTWTLATEQSMTYATATVTAAASNVEVAALDGGNGIAGFVLRMPLLGGALASSASQIMALFGRAQAGAATYDLTWSVRLSGRNITSHDMYEASVSNVVDLGVSTGNPNSAVVRNRLVALLTGLNPSDVPGLPTATGSGADAYVLNLELLVRTQPQEVLLVGAVLPTANYDDVLDNRSIEMADLTNGTALAEADARLDKDCDPIPSLRQPKADIIWMADISGSTDDDRTNIADAAQTIVTALANNNVDFRLGVVRHTENEARLGANNGGTLFGSGFVRDPTQFDSYLRNTSGYNDGCEFGLSAVRDAIDRALPRTAVGATENPRRLRGDATVAVVYISDEYAQEITLRSAQECFAYNTGCNTGIRDYYTGPSNNVCLTQPNSNQQGCIDSIVQPFIDQLESPEVDGVAFAQVIPPSAAPITCTGYACPALPPSAPPPQPANEPGIGYIEVVNATQGAFYTPCNANPGAALTPIVDAVAAAASSFQLTGSPISSTIRVGVVRLGGMGSGAVEIVPRDKDDGFDYDPAAKTIFFRGLTYRPALNDLVVISYRTWLPPEDPCPPCTAAQECDPVLGICVCSQAVCAACGANEVCDSDCNCICGGDCNGQCGGNTVCDPATCQCECPTDCGGGCAVGEVCNPTTCACECGADCGGACDGTLLECNPAACNCQCNDCSGRCTGNTLCNTSTCDCTCAPDCEAGCQNNEVCNPENNCACECTEDCNGRCPDNTVCDPTSCACECPVDCDSNCPNNQICNPATGCNCVCPADCGGCSPDEICDLTTCSCVSAL